MWINRITFFLSVLVIAAGVHQAKWAIENQMAPDSKTAVALVLVVCIVGLILFSAVIEVLPLILSQSGHSGLGQAFSKFSIDAERRKGKGSPAYTKALINGAKVAHLSGNLDECLELCQQAQVNLEEEKRIKGANPAQNDWPTMEDGQLSTILTMRAWVHHDKQEFEKAIPLCEQSLVETRALQQRRMASKANRKQEQSSIYTRDLSKSATAGLDELYLDAFLTLEEVMALELLGLLKSTQNELTATRDIFEKARLLRMQTTRITSDENWHLNYSFALMNLNRNDEALTILMNAKQKYYKKMSPHGKAMLLVNLGETHRRLCNYTSAKQELTEALKMQKKLYPPHHYSLAETSGYLAKLSNDMGNTSARRTAIL